MGWGWGGKQLCMREDGGQQSMKQEEDSLGDTVFDQLHALDTPGAAAIAKACSPVHQSGRAVVLAGSKLEHTQRRWVVVVVVVVTRPVSMKDIS